MIHLQCSAFLRVLRHQSHVLKIGSVTNIKVPLRLVLTVECWSLCVWVVANDVCCDLKLLSSAFSCSFLRLLVAALMILFFMLAASISLILLLVMRLAIRQIDLAISALVNPLSCQLFEGLPMPLCWCPLLQPLAGRKPLWGGLAPLGDYRPYDGVVHFTAWTFLDRVRHALLLCPPS